MGYLRRPSYYKYFHCIASSCTDSCCIGWEIDIDEDTMNDYRQVKGSFGKRLKENIALPPNDSEEPAHFIQTQHERCPFLNSCNLCDIFITLGEEYLSQICTHHPRYYDWFLEGQEAGLGLCCEEAARLILKKTDYPEFEVIQDDEGTEPLLDEDLLLEQQLERQLFSMREELFHQIKSNKNPSFDEICNQLYATAWKQQERYDEILFSNLTFLEKDETETKESDNNPRIKWSEQFWQPIFLHSLLDFYLSLEINDAQWWKQLRQIKAEIKDIVNHRANFLKFYEKNLYEYEQLLIYFLYRHFMKARENGFVLEKIIFALISTCMIQLLDVWEWKKTGRLTLSQQVDICKLYSKEIEYDEDNTEKVSFYFN